jgi:hypothetical protein
MMILDPESKNHLWSGNIVQRAYKRNNFVLSPEKKVGHRPGDRPKAFAMLHSLDGEASWVW